MQVQAMLGRSVIFRVFGMEVCVVADAITTVQRVFMRLIAGHALPAELLAALLPLAGSANDAIADGAVLSALLLLRSCSRCRSLTMEDWGSFIEGSKDDAATIVTNLLQDRSAETDRNHVWVAMLLRLSRATERPRLMSLSIQVGPPPFLPIAPCRAYHGTYAPLPQPTG